MFSSHNNESIQITASKFGSFGYFVTTQHYLACNIFQFLDRNPACNISTPKTTNYFFSNSIAICSIYATTTGRAFAYSSQMPTIFSVSSAKHSECLTTYSECLTTYSECLTTYSECLTTYSECLTTYSESCTMGSKPVTTSSGKLTTYRRQLAMCCASLTTGRDAMYYVSTGNIPARRPPRFSKTSQVSLLYCNTNININI